MGKKEIGLIVFIFLVVTGLFFYKTIGRGWVPFPGDLLIAEYKPWQAGSYLGYTPGSYPHKAQYPDTLRQLYPWRTQAISQWKEGQVPLWNPYNFSGTPLLANFQSTALYPLNLIYAAVSDIDAWSVLVFLQPLLAALFTYFYSRAIKLSSLAGTLAALSFGFSGFMSVWLEYNTVGHVILWLPLLLLAIEHLNTKQGVLWQCIFAGSITMSLLAGHPQVAAYTLLFVAVYAAFRLPAKLRPFTALLALLGVGMAAVQLVPGIELITHAARSPHEFTALFEKILIQPVQLLALPFPNIFGNPATRTYMLTDTFFGKVTSIGLLPLFFLLSTLRTKNTLARFYLIAAGSVLLLITANPLTYVVYQIPIPLITSSSPTLMSFLFAFSLSIAAAFGMDYWIRDRHSVRKLIIRAAQLLGIIAAVYLWQKNPVALRALIYSGGVSAAILGIWYVAIRYPKWMQFAMAAVLLVHAADLFMFFTRFNPFVPKELVYPHHPIVNELRDKGAARYWGYGTAALPSNFATQLSLYSPEGYDPLYPKWYGELVHGSKDGRIPESFDTTTRSDATIAPGFGEEGFANPFRKRVLDALSVQFILDRPENGSTQQTFPPHTYQNIYSAQDWNILENTTAAAKAFLTTDIQTYETRSDFETKFFDPAFDPSAQVLLPALPQLTYPLDQNGTATVTSYTENEIAIVTNSNSPAVLVVTDTYYPGWKATIDGNDTQILRANWTLRAAAVPQGEHTVIMRYEPVSFTVGKIISIISFIILCVGIFLRSRI